MRSSVLGRPLHRIIAALAADGLDVAEGTLVGALQQVVPLLAPWAEAIEAHVAASGYVACATQTGWRVFADTPGKDGNRWWLWVFGTDEATVFAIGSLPQRRSARESAGHRPRAGRPRSWPPAGHLLAISTARTSRWPRSRASIRCGASPISDGTSCGPGAAHPDALGQWCHAWTQRFALLYRAHTALRAATTQTESESEAREQALAALPPGLR